MRELTRSDIHMIHAISAGDGKTLLSSEGPSVIRHELIGPNGEVVRSWWEAKKSTVKSVCDFFDMCEAFTDLFSGRKN